MDYKKKYYKYKIKYLKLLGGTQNLGLQNNIQRENVGTLDNVIIISNILPYLSSCHDKINLILSSKDISTYLNKDKILWIDLINSIQIPDFPNYNDESNQQLNHPYIRLLENLLCNDNDYCKLFFTKCLHKKMLEKYNKPSLKLCWYEAIRRNNINDYQYFNILTDTTIIEESAFNKLLVYTTLQGKRDISELTQVIIPDSVTTIGKLAFANNTLTQVTIPNSVTKIDKHAFQNNQLTQVNIPDSVTIIGDVAFHNNRLEEVTIGNSVTTIGKFAFENNKLEEVTIPKSVTTIGFGAFSKNILNQVTIPNSNTKISRNAFDRNVKIIRN